MDDLDRGLINALQDGIPICERPFAEAAMRFGLTEQEVADRIAALREAGFLSRFGPMYDAVRLGGGLTLAAMAVPEERFDEVAATVDAFPEVAHNYARDHALNMWFVLATETPERIGQAIAEIEEATGLDVLDLPKEEEFFLSLRLEA